MDKQNYTLARISNKWRCDTANQVDHYRNEKKVTQRPTCKSAYMYRLASQTYIELQQNCARNEGHCCARIIEGLSVFIAFPDDHVSKYSHVHAIVLFSCTQPKAYIYVTDMIYYQICTKEAIIYGTVLLHVRRFVSFGT